MKHNILTFITNTQNQYVADVNSTFVDNLKAAKVKYHQLLASLENANDVLVAVVMLVDDYGNQLDGYREVIDNRPEPEPEEVTEE